MRFFRFEFKWHPKGIAELAEQEERCNTGLTNIFGQLEEEVEPRNSKLLQQGSEATNPITKWRIAMQLASLRTHAINLLLEAHLLLQETAAAQNHIGLERRRAIHASSPLRKLRPDDIAEGQVDAQVGQEHLQDLMEAFASGSGLNIKFNLDPAEIVAEMGGDPTMAVMSSADTTEAASTNRPDTVREDGGPRLAVTHHEADDGGKQPQTTMAAGA